MLVLLADVVHHRAPDRHLALLSCGMDDRAHVVEIATPQQAFDRPDGGRAHRQGLEPDGRETQRLDRAARILPAKRQRSICFGAAFYDALKEGQERDVQRVIAPPHPLVLTVGGEKELLKVIAPDRQELDLLKEFLWGKGEAGGL